MTKVDRAAGRAAEEGVSIATPVFDGAVEPISTSCAEDRGFNVSGQSTLYDGRTGEEFDRR
jgi:DNA-directed RNA polymerase subunit beta